MRLKNFHVEKKLQVEVLRFLVRNVGFKMEHHKALKEEFRRLDTDKSGNLSIEEIRQAFGGSLSP